MGPVQTGGGVILRTNSLQNTDSLIKAIRRKRVKGQFDTSKYQIVQCE